MDYTNDIFTDKTLHALLLEAKVLDGVMEKIEFPDDGGLSHAMALGELKRRTWREIVKLIWLHMDHVQLSYFRDHFNREVRIDPDCENEVVLVEFALMYPDLMEKVQGGLIEFFERFVEEYKK